MKKPMTHTKVSVKLRKSETQELWYLYLESYPVYRPGEDKPHREREYLNRTIRTPMWDRTKPSRGTTEHADAFMAKRDLNGIIMCRSPKDKETCKYADNVRSIRQREFDNKNLYSEDEEEMMSRKERGKVNYLDFLDKEIRKRWDTNASKSIIQNWSRLYELIILFKGTKYIPFSSIDYCFMDDFKTFLLTAPKAAGKKGTISQNTAGTYFSVFKASLHQAFVNDYIDVDIATKIKGISEKENRREHLTIEELNMLAATPCDYPMLKKAAFFSALTGLRHSDIYKLTWGEIVKVGEHYRLNFTQQKTGGVEYMPISEQAYQLCGERKGPDKRVFEGLQPPSWINRPLKKWVEAAGINKHITFHCFRHSFATNQLILGTDLYTVSKMLGHTDVKITQVYAKVVDSKKEAAADAIHLNLGTDVLV